VLEADEEIREIKKEIIEARGLVIKTNNLTNSLAADIKAIAKRQAGYEQRFNWNSAIAYVLFASLAFLGLKLASDAQIREIAAEQTELERNVDELESQLAEENRRAEQRARAQTAAGEFYDLVRQKRRADAVEAYDELREMPLSPAEEAFFRDIVDQFRLDLSVKSYRQGLDLVRTGRYAEAAEAFEEAIRLREGAAHIPRVRFELAKTLRRLDKQGEALVLAQAVLQQNVDPEIHPEATWLLSQCAEELDRIDQARDALRELIRKWPRSAFAPQARRHLGELNLQVLRSGRRG